MNTKHLLPIFVVFAMASCAIDNGATMDSSEEYSGNGKINLSGEISQLYQTRANDSGFCDQDEIGIYVVDFDAEGKAQSLATTGNRADNLKHIFDEASYKWNPLHEIYWKDTKTHVDIYGYYPYQSVQNVSAQRFRWTRVKQEIMGRWADMRHRTFCGPRWQTWLLLTEW